MKVRDKSVSDQIERLLAVSTHIRLIILTDAELVLGLTE